MQTVCCYGYTNRFEVVGAEGCEVAVGEMGDGVEVFGFVLWRGVVRGIGGS